MDVIGTLLGWALTAFIVLMVARMVFDWTGLIGRGGSSPWLRRARMVSYAGTEPVIAPVRRLMRPVRAGGLSIDLAFTVVFVLALILRSVAFSL